MRAVYYWLVGSSYLQQQRNNLIHATWVKNLCLITNGQNIFLKLATAYEDTPTYLHLNTA